jgi:GNAT superfamily N-acetyltransferase
LWLQKDAAKSDGKTARTFVVCESSRLIGYYCIAAGSIERKAIPKEIKEHGLPSSIPVVIIGRLARDKTYKGKGLGPDLLSDALKRILTAANTIGVRGVLVHALDDDSVPFYEKSGFLPCPIGERTFFLPIETIDAAL